MDPSKSHPDSPIAPSIIGSNDSELTGQSVGFGPGSQVGTFILTDRLTSPGPFGDEWLALDSETGYALLAIFPSQRQASDRGIIRRVMREVRHAEALTHASAITGTRIQLVNNQRILLCDQPRGRTLASIFDEGRQLGTLDILTIVRQVAGIVAHSAARDVVHRWIRPSTIWLDDGKRVSLHGYGLWPLADWHSEVQLESNELLPLRYSAPEVISGEEVTAAADVWSIGVLLAALITGHASSQANATLTSLVRNGAIKRVAVDSPALDGIQDELDGLVASMCNADPDARPEAKALLTRLDTLFQSFQQDSPDFTAVVRKASSQLRHNLPLLPAPILGRATDVERLTSQLELRQIVTVLGPGGVGKTSIAVTLGRSLVDDFYGGVWFCDLAAATNEHEVAIAIAQGMGLTVPMKDIEALIHGAIEGRERAVYIFDNCEQVIGHVQKFLSKWLAASQDARYVLTSRSPIGIAGEFIYQLLPLSVPSEKAVASANLRRTRLNPEFSSIHIPPEVSASPAVQLFIDRASSVRRGFQLNATNWQSIGSIVRRLDGIPLAVRLAAAQVASLSPAQILERLAGSTVDLSGDGELAGERHQSLGKAIKWSWDLLTPWEQATFAQLSVFRGGFTIDAAEAVVDVSQWPEAPWVMDIVHSLWVKSLLTCFTDKHREIRLSMLETIHEFATQRFAMLDSQDVDVSIANAAIERHWQFFSNLGHPAIFGHTPVGPERVTHSADLANVIIAFHRARDTNATVEASRLGTASMDILIYTNRAAEALAIADLVQAIPSESPEATAWREYLFAECRGRAFGPESQLEHANRAAMAASECRSPMYAAMAYSSMQWAAMFQSDHDLMIKHGQEALRFAGEMPEALGMRIHVMLTMAFSYVTHGDPEGAERVLTQVDELIGPKGNPEHRRWLLNELVLHNLYVWKIREAIRVQEQVIEIENAKTTDEYQTDSNFQYGIILRVAGEIEMAREALTQCVKRSRIEGTFARGNLAESHLRLTEFQAEGFTIQAEEGLLAGLDRISVSNVRYFHGGGPLYAVAAWSAATRGDFDLAEARLEKAESAERLCGFALPPVRHARAFLCMKRGEFDQARASLAKAQEDQSNDPDDVLSVKALSYQVEVEAARVGKSLALPGEAIERAISGLAELDALIQRERLTPQSQISMATEQLRESLRPSKHERADSE